jgi:hypothetical protein
MAADAVPVLDRPFEKIRNGGEVDVGMRPHIHPPARRQAGGAELVDENEWADHPSRFGGERAANLEVAKVMGGGGYRFHDRDSFALLNHKNRSQGKWGRFLPLKRRNKSDTWKQSDQIRRTEVGSSQTNWLIGAWRIAASYVAINNR